MAYALIDYGDGGRAEIWGDFTKETAVRAFYKSGEWERAE